MQTAARALARNLKRKRLERAISLSELARASGVSKATLSGLERGNGNPSVDTVWALADALNVPFGELFDENDDDVVQVRRIADAQVVTSERGFTGRKLLSRRGRGGVEVYVLDLKRGAKRKSAAHSPGVVDQVASMLRVNDLLDRWPSELSSRVCMSTICIRKPRNKSG